MKNIKPQLISALTCDQVITDQSGKNTLIGLFSNIYADNFPARHSKMTLFCAWLNNGRMGTNTLKVIFIDPSGKEVLNIKPSIEFKDKKVITYAILNFEGIVFPQKGVYKIEVYLEGDKEVEIPIILENPPRVVQS